MRACVRRRSSPHLAQPTWRSSVAYRSAQARAISVQYKQSACCSVTFACFAQRASVGGWCWCWDRGGRRWSGYRTCSTMTRACDNARVFVCCVCGVVVRPPVDCWRGSWMTARIICSVLDRFPPPCAPASLHNLSSSTKTSAFLQCQRTSLMTFA